MIKFFRKIRQNLLTEGKTQLYFKYAFGEIILVVIGILIAVSVNNYSQKRKGIQQSEMYLNDMLQDLSVDTLYLNRMIEKMDTQLITEDWLLKKDSFDLSDIDSIRLALTHINWTFNINDRSYQNIQNASDTKLIGYEHLYSEISKYYNVTKNRIVNNNQMELLESSKKSTFDQIVSENLLITTKQYNDYSGFYMELDLPTASVEGDLDAIINSLSEIQTKNILYEKFARHNYIQSTLIYTEREVRSLIKKINTSLGND